MIKKHLPYHGQSQRRLCCVYTSWSLQGYGTCKMVFLYFILKHGFVVQVAIYNQIIVLIFSKSYKLGIYFIQMKERARKKNNKHDIKGIKKSQRWV